METGKDSDMNCNENAYWLLKAYRATRRLREMGSDNYTIAIAMASYLESKGIEFTEREVEHVCKN